MAWVGRIKGYDTYTDPDDLYTKRGLSWKMFLERNFNAFPNPTFPAHPMISMKTHRSYVFNGGVIGIDMSVTRGDYAGQGYIRARLKVGDYCYGTQQEYITDKNNPSYSWFFQEDAWFFIPIRIDGSRAADIEDAKGSGKPILKIDIPVYSKGVDGFQIPIPENLTISGKVEFCVIQYVIYKLPESSQKYYPVRMSDIAIKYALKDCEISETDNTYKKEIGGSQNEEYEISSNLSMHRINNPYSDHNVLSNNGYYLDKQDVLIEDGQDGQEAIIEDNTMWRAYNHYRLPRKLLTIKVRYDKAKTYTPNQRITYQNKDYAILSADYNWRDSEVKLTLIEIV